METKFNYKDFQNLLKELEKHTLKELYTKNNFSGKYYFTSNNRPNSYFYIDSYLAKPRKFMIDSNGNEIECKFNGFEYYETSWDNWVIIPKQLFSLWKKVIKEHYINFNYDYPTPKKGFLSWLKEL